MAKRVVIIGGGIAGLSAATELLRHGCHVTVLEAKERFGGRINTLRDGSFPIELGAEFLHGRSEPLLEVIRDAKLSTHDVPDRNQLFESGQLCAVNLWKQIGRVTQRIDPLERDQSFGDFLKHERLDKQTYRLATAFVDGFNAAHHNIISAHAVLRADYSSSQMDGAHQWRIDEGYAALVDALVAKAQASGAVLRNQTAVRRICWTENSVEVKAELGTTIEMFEAEAAVITVSLGVLKARTILFEPALHDQQEAINQLRFGNATKIALVFRTRWWRDADFGFVHALDAAIPTWWSDPRGPILTGWAGGPKADALLGHNAEQLANIGVDILAKIFSTRRTAIESELVKAHTYNWSGDPHVRGAYSYIPVDGLILPRVLGAPVGHTLFFAGEATATDGQTGTVFAAFESGQRAAREILGM